MQSILAWCKSVGGEGKTRLSEQVANHHQMTQEGVRIFIRECSFRHKHFWRHDELCMASTSEALWLGSWVRIIWCFSGFEKMCLMFHVKVFVHCIEMNTTQSCSFFWKLFFTADYLRTVVFQALYIGRGLWGALSWATVVVLLPCFPNFLTCCLGLLQGHSVS